MAKIKIKDFLVQSTFSLENGGEMQFLTAPLQSCCPCNNFGILLKTKLEKLHKLVFDLERGLKYFDDVELTHRL